MRHVLFIGVSVLAGCGGPQRSVMTALTPVPLDSGITAWGAVSIEVRGVKAELVEAGQVTLTKRDVPRQASQTAPIGQRFDSVVPGPYEVRVQVVGYIPASASADVRGGERLRFRAHLRRNRVQLTEVAD
jgi:hypothetical protein